MTFFSLSMMYVAAPYIKHSRMEISLCEKTTSQIFLIVNIVLCGGI